MVNRPTTSVAASFVAKARTRVYINRLRHHLRPSPASITDHRRQHPLQHLPKNLQQFRRSLPSPYRQQSQLRHFSHPAGRKLIELSPMPAALRNPRCPVSHRDRISPCSRQEQFPRAPHLSSFLRRWNRSPNRDHQSRRLLIRRCHLTSPLVHDPHLGPAFELGLSCLNRELRS